MIPSVSLLPLYFRRLIKKGMPPEDSEHGAMKFLLRSGTSQDAAQRHKFNLMIYKIFIATLLPGFSMPSRSTPNISYLKLLTKTDSSLSRMAHATECVY